MTALGLQRTGTRWQVVRVYLVAGLVTRTEEVTEPENLGIASAKLSHACDALVEELVG